MSRIILALADSFKLAGRVEVTLDQVKAMAATWRRYLAERVPLEMLDASVERAFGDHEGSFVMTAFEVDVAYRRIKAERDQAAAEAAKTDPVARCTHYGNHATPEGDIVALNFYTDREELMPCPHCRQSDVEKWKADQIARSGEFKRPRITADEAVKTVLRSVK